MTPVRARLVAVLGTLAAFGPLSTTMYLPSMPEVGDDIDAGASAVQLTLTSFAIGLAIGQLLAGPLSDRFGRRTPLVTGLVLYILASLLCGLASSMELLVSGRALQGACASAGIVIGRAVVRDVRSGPAGARLLSILVTVVGVTTVAAPLLGGGVLLFASWRGIFVAQAVVATVTLIAVLVIVPETLPVSRRGTGGVLAFARRAIGLLRDRVVLGCALTCGLVYGAMLASLAGGGFVFQEVYGASAQVTALVFAGGAVGLVVTSSLATRVVMERGSPSLLRLGVLVSGAGGLLALVAVISGAGLWLLGPSLALLFSGHGLTLPNATTIALADHGDQAGTASGALGVVQYAIGAVAAPLTGVGGEDTALPTALVVAALSLAAVAAAGLALSYEPADG